MAGVRFLEVDGASVDALRCGVVLPRRKCHGYHSAFPYDSRFTHYHRLVSLAGCLGHRGSSS